MTLSEFLLAWRSQAPVIKGKCFYCGGQTRRGGLSPSSALFQTKDHVMPRCVAGNRSVPYNLAICCQKCNSAKGSLTMQEFKHKTGIETFHAEEVLGVKIEDLSDIAEVTQFILSARRSIKSHGRPDPRLANDSLQG